MKKFFIFLVFVLLTSLNAKVVNQIVALVNNEPITSVEINSVANGMRIPSKKALEFLINQKLFISQMKKINLLVSDAEVNEAISQIMKKNNLTEEKLKLALQKENKTMEQFRSDIKKQIEQEKILAPQLAKLRAKITPANVKAFYKSHPEMFSTFTSVTLTRFHAPSKALLQKVVSTNGRVYVPGVMAQQGTLRGAQITNSLRFLVSKTPKGGFSPIMQSPNGFDVFKINSVSGTKLVDYKIAEKAALNAFVQTQREQIMKNYAQSLKSDAVIEILDPAYK